MLTSMDIKRNFLKLHKLLKIPKHVEVNGTADTRTQKVVKLM